MATRREHQRNKLVQDGLRAMQLYAQGMKVAEVCAQLGRSRQTLWRAVSAAETAHPGAAALQLPAWRADKAAAPQEHPHGRRTGSDADPLLDGWEPETVERVTESDLEDLLA
jgi:transposase